jgi:hypothetical protein
MSFSIIVQNDGVDGTVEVRERLNLNEFREVLKEVLSQGETRHVDCFGTPPKEFYWMHHASMLSGGPEELDDGQTLRVNSS